MTNKIKILLFENSTEEIEQTLAEIEKAKIPFDLEKVSAKDSFVSSLNTYRPDIILSDYTLPDFNSLAALRIARDIYPDIPFIIISDPVGEEAAVRCIKAGADDYVVRDNIDRLGAAMQTVFENKRTQAEKSPAEKFFTDSEETLRLVFEASNEAIWEWLPVTDEFNWSHRAADLFGLTEDDPPLNGERITKLLHPEDKQPFFDVLRSHMKYNEPFHVEFRMRQKDGTYKWFLARGNAASRNNDGTVTRMVGSVVDIQQRKEYEEALRESEERYKSLFENNHTVMLLVDPGTGRVVDANPAACTFYGYERDDLRSLRISEIIALPEDQITGRVKAIQQGEQQKFRSRHCLASGEIRDVEALTGQITVRGKRLLYSIVNDVTERRRAEEALKQSHEFYLTLFEKFPGMIWRSDKDGNIDYVNQSMLHFTGRAIEEETGWKWLEIVHPDDREMVEKSQSQYIKNRKPFQMEYRLRDRNGEYRWIIDAGKPYEDSEGNYTGYIGACYDISQRKLTEERMNHVNRLYSVLSHVNQAIVKIQDQNVLLHEVCKVSVDQGRFVMAWIGFHDTDSNTIQPVAQYGNDSGYLDSVKFSLSKDEEEYSPAQIVLTGGQSYITNDIETDPNIAAHRTEALACGFRSAASFPIQSNDSVIGVFTVYSGEVNYFNAQEIQLLEEIAEDISFAIQKIADDEKRLEAERSLQVSEERFRSLVQSMDDIVFVLDRKQRHIGVYGKWLEKFNLSEELFIGKTPREVMGPDAAKIHEDANLRALNGEHVVYTWISNSSGQERHLQTALSPLRDTDGNITGVVGVGRDVTELREAQSMQRLQSVALESAANAIVITDSNGIIQWVNKSFSEMTGYTRKEVTGINPHILKSSRHNESFYKNLWDTISSGQVWSGEIINKRKDGSLYTEEMTITPVLDDAEQISHYIAIKQDVTNQKQLQQHLFESQKLESVGTLASGIAHDFNNILGIILGYASLLDNLGIDDERHRRHLDAITKAVNRGANLVQQILTFARKTDLSLDIVKVNSIIEELTKMLEETFPKTISINKELAKNIPVIVIDQGQLHQALLNLLVNARDAILMTGEDAGEITIQTGVVPGSKLREKYPDAGPEKYISVAVTDTGIGMDESTVERIFEPFYTTKEQGKGTGLGLSVVYGIVNSYRGFIDVKSEPGTYSTFTLFLPVRPGMQSDDDQSDNIMQDLPGGNETILIVEDEALLLDALVMILEEKGYTVVTAHDGAKALEVYEKDRDSIDVVLSDVGLPKMNGAELFKRIKKINPEVQYILASGYFDPAKKKELLNAGVQAFIPKPYQPDEVLLAVRSVLDE